jgi:hypothetical protein
MVLPSLVYVEQTHILPSPPFFLVPTATEVALNEGEALGFLLICFSLGI